MHTNGHTPDPSVRAKVHIGSFNPPPKKGFLRRFINCGVLFLAALSLSAAGLVGGVVEAIRAVTG